VCVTRVTFAQIYREIGLTVAGKQKIEDLIQATFKEFTDFEELRLVIRNAVRGVNGRVCNAVTDGLIDGGGDPGSGALVP
jgi:hypothetical protein